MFTSIFGAVLAACFARTALAIPTISVKGAKFFADGEQFFLKGRHLGPPPAAIQADCTQVLRIKALQLILSSTPSNVNSMPSPWK
jgi:hypothetical protein